MNPPIFVLPGCELLQRDAARHDRAMMLAHLNRSGTVTLDASRVDFMSAAYADELLGVLAQHVGRSWVLERIRVIGAHDTILRTLAAAICERSRVASRASRRDRAQAAAAPLRH